MTRTMGAERRASGFRRWRDIAWRVKEEVARDNLSLVAAGTAFFGLLALFPAIAAAVSIYGLFSDPADVARQLKGLAETLPDGAQQVLGRQLDRVAGASGGALGVGAAIGILVALWSAAKGMKGVMTALNIVYGVGEERGFIRLNLVALGLTLAAIVFLLVALVLVAAVPVAIDLVGLSGWLAWLVSLVRWPILIGVALLGLALVYRYAPNRPHAAWRWITPGAVLAATLWILGSIAFSVYVANFGNYNETYGAISAVIVLMLWLFLTAYVVLLGGELNAEVDRRTAR